MRHPAHGPTKPTGVEATYLPAAGTDVAGGMTKGGLVVATSASARKWHTNRALAPPAGL
jgi:hypothetical protein